MSQAQKKLGTNFEQFWPQLCLSPTLLVLIGVSYPVLRPGLHYESGLKKLGANFEHFWPVVWPQGLPNWMIIFTNWMIVFFKLDDNLLQIG